MDDNPIRESKSLAPVVGSAFASVLAAIFIIVLAHQFGLIRGHGGFARQRTSAPFLPAPPPPRTAVTAAQLVPVIPALPTNLAPPDTALAAMVEQGVDALDLPAKTAVMPNEQALEEVADIKRGDYEAATRLAASVLAQSKVNGWHFTPFSRFVNSMSHGNDPLLLDHLNEWVRQQPQSALAYLMRGQYYFATGWTLRTAEVGAKIPRDVYALFEQDLRLSVADMHDSIDLDPHNPWSYYRLLCAVAAGGNGSEVQSVFEMAIKAHPEYYELYRYRLYMLTPKWGGSVDAMYDFAARYAGPAPAGSPLKMLYLQVYANVLDAAWFDCGSRRGDRLRDCVDSAMKERRMPEDIRNGVTQALNLYKVSDPIYFSEALWPILTDMASTPGSSASGFGETLQTAASIMGSDNRLTHESGHNSYVLDDVTAQVWAQIGNNENAEQKYHDALTDIQHTSFHDEVERNEALATVLSHMANFSRNTSQLVNVIVDYTAAERVAGINFTEQPHQKCYAYYKMKRWPEAVTECTRMLEANNHYLDLQYFLGRTCEGLQQWDTALAVYEPVALSADNSFRVGAALWMSVDYGKKSDFAGELKSLNEHGYLFDRRMQEDEDLAAAFNNRCHALMELGRLDEALKDCSMSLDYGQLPDAIHKRDELLRRLGKGS